MISRRRFLIRTAAFTSLASVAWSEYDLRAFGYTGDIRLERVTIRSPRVPTAFDGYTFGFLADAHLGIWIPELWIERALDLIDQEKASLLVLGGDYICVNDDVMWEHLGIVRNYTYAGIKRQDAVPLLFQSAASIFGRRSYPDGMVAIAGNHEHWNSTYAFTSIFGKIPSLKLLINEHAVIKRSDQSLTLYGIDDYLTGRPMLFERWQGEQQPGPPHDFRILISHNPDLVSKLVVDRIQSFDLALCGHTHGGQVCLPGLGAVTYQVYNREFARGLVERGDYAVYTTRGVGVVGVPYRINCPPEVTVVTLVRT